MCLTTRDTKREIDKWLKTQPDMITAYKIVTKVIFPSGKYKLIPYHYSNWTKKYKKKNRIRGERIDLKPYDTPRRLYKAYFHLWLEIPNVFKRNGVFQKRLIDQNEVLIECLVPKHLITAKGIHEFGPAIISKGFDIVAETF